jgi:GTP-binding protein EngB required for normal cell division
MPMVETEAHVRIEDLKKCNISPQDQIKPGLHRHITLQDFMTRFQVPAEQILTGIQTEHEHTDDDCQASEIAKDHLAEMKDYYTKLDKMEHDAKQKPMTTHELGQLFD